MPTAPGYGGPKVSTPRSPGVRVGVNAPRAAFQPPPSAVGAVADVATQVFEAAAKRADQVALLEAETALTAAKSGLLYGENGALMRKGKNAFSAPQEINEQWLKATSEIEGKLKNSRQKEAFRRAVNAEQVQVFDTVQRHVARERMEYDGQQTDAFINQQVDLAIRGYQDPAEVQGAITKTVASLQDWATANGVSSEVLEQAVSERVSRIHVGVLGQMMADDNDLLASKYFQANRDSIAPKDLDRVQEAIQESSSRGESQRQSDEIMRKFSDEASALEAARQIENPKLRDLVENRVKERWGERRRIEREQENDLYVSAANYIDAKPGVSAQRAIPPGVWTQLKPTQRRSLQIYAEDAGGGGGKGGSSSSAGSTDAWLDFLSLDIDDVRQLNRNEFETRYLSKLGKKERGMAITRWKNARDGKGSGGSAGSRTEVPLKDIEQTLRVAKLVGTDEKSGLNASEKRVLAVTEREVNEQVRRFTAEKGRAPTREEERAIVDAAVIRRAFPASGAEEIVFKGEGDVGRMRKRGNNLIVKYGEIPATKRAELENKIKAMGGAVRRDKVERAYAQWILGDAAAVRAILAEK